MVEEGEESQPSRWRWSERQVYPVGDHGDVVEGSLVALLQGNGGEEDVAVFGKDRLLVLVAAAKKERRRRRKHEVIG